MPRDDGIRRVLSVDHSQLPQKVTDFVQTTEELMGKDPSASLTKMALADTNVLSDDVASELAAKTAQLDSLDQAVLSLQGDIQLLRQSSAELATQKEQLSTLLAELEKPSQAEAATEVAQEAEAQKPSAQAVVEQLKLAGLTVDVLRDAFKILMAEENQATSSAPSSTPAASETWLQAEGAQPSPPPVVQPKLPPPHLRDPPEDLKKQRLQ